MKSHSQITNQNTRSLQKYLQEIRKIDRLSIGAEANFAKLNREGDTRARQKLINSNLLFVVSVAKCYQYCGVPLEDLICEGTLGLIKASQTFDETRGFKFISYAKWIVKQSILQAISEQSRIVRIPQNQVSMLNKIKKASNLFMQKFEREPCPDELAEMLDITIEEITATLRNENRHMSIDAPTVLGEETTLLDVLPNEDIQPPDSKFLADSLKSEIQAALLILAPRESEIISLIYGLNDRNQLSAEEIGIKFCLTPERVRQVIATAIHSLRQSIDRESPE